MKKFNTDLPYYISSYGMTELINKLSEFEDNEIEVSWNSLGGSIWAGWNFADFLSTTDKKITARVTGITASMGGVLLPYFAKVIGTAQSDVMIHSTMSNVKAITKKSNDELYKCLAAKIDEVKFEKIANISLKDLMNLEGDERKDVWLSGQQAYEIGLYDELIDLTDSEKLNKDNMLNDFQLMNKVDFQIPSNNLNNNNMDMTELRAKHPEVFTEVLNVGTIQGKETEQERVNVWMAFNDVAPEKVKSGIESGNAMKESEKIAFLLLSQKAELQASLETASADNVAEDKKAGKLKSDLEKSNEVLDNAFDELGINEEGAE